MDRQYLEIDLPEHAARHLAPAIDTWLEGGARPGDRLFVPFLPLPTALMHPAVTVRAREDEIVLRLVDLEGVQRPYFLLETADPRSRRLVDQLEHRLTSSYREAA